MQDYIDRINAYCLCIALDAAALSSAFAGKS